MKHALRTAFAALLSLLAVTAALAQTAPATLGYHTVYGRIGASPGDSGPGQTIPFATLSNQLGIPKLPEIYATTYGVKCDGTTPDSTALQLAVNTANSLGGGTVILPAGTCVINSNIFLNKYGAPGTLTVPGLKIKGQGKGVTILDTRVANDFAISVNPAYRAAHQAQFNAAASASGGTLATNTYYIQIIVNDGLGNVINATSPKAVAVTGPTGSISIALPALSNPGYSFDIYCDTASTPAHYCGLGGGFNATGRLPGGTVVATVVGSAAAVPSAKQAVWQEASISDLSITNSTAVANASGVSFFKVGYSDLTNVYMHGLTGDGFSVTNYTGDIDGSFNVRVANSKFDTIAGTCVNAAGNVLELSNFTVDDRTVFNICGTAPAVLNVSKTIATISNANPGQVATSTAHNWALRDMVYISGVTGMTLADNWYRVCGSLGSSTFQLCDLNGVQIDTTSLGSYNASSGAAKLSWRPPFISGGAITGGGGCLAWTGLIGTFRNLDFTLCNNFGIYFTEAGSSDNATIENVDLENTAGVGLYIAALAGGSFTNSECLSATAFGATISCVQLGTGFAGGGVQNFAIDRIKVRSDVTPSVGFAQFANTNIGATFIDTVRRGHITWQSFDAAGQTRSNGFTDDPIPGQVQFSISATDTAKLAPVGYGACIPIHLKANGEWVCIKVPTAGATAATGTLAATTTYNFYAYNSAATSAPAVVAIDPPSTTATTIVEGYKVKTGDTSRTFIGTAPTDGSGHFQTTGAFASWYPPGASVAATTLTGTLQAAQEPAHTGDVTNSAGSLALTLAAGNAGNLNSGTLLAARMPALTGDATTSAGAVAVTVTKINGVDQTAAWSTYTPTVTSQVGTITAYTATGRYKQIGKTILLETDVVITTVGTAAGVMLVTVPVNAAAFRYAGVSFDYGATLKSGAGYIAGAATPTFFTTADATGTTFFGANAKVVSSFTYEVP